ncbi:MAG: phosphoribosylformylglycinamidine synthase [Oscillospiraceae bacterium]|nr:phosphoribosylformylglycinamidine synthase [Oscillospiraceae bacterium]
MGKIESALVNGLTEELAQDVGLTGEFLAYMALQNLPPPCRVLFNYELHSKKNKTLTEIDLLLLTPGGVFIIEVKSHLKQLGEILGRNKMRLDYLQQRLPALKGLPFYSIVVYHNERTDKLVWMQGSAFVVQMRYLRNTVQWLAEQNPQALAPAQIDALHSALQNLERKQPKQQQPPTPNIPKKKENRPMVYRIYTTRREGFTLEAETLLREWQEQLHIEGMTGLTLLNRYDVEGIDAQQLRGCIPTVFSEPQTDVVLQCRPQADFTFATEYLPGQYDQRADSCAQCIQIASGGQRPLVRTAKVFCIKGSLEDGQLEAMKKTVVNPVESREASLDRPLTLQLQTEPPQAIPVLAGFIGLEDAGLEAFVSEYALAMDLDDLRFCRDYFKGEEGRDPTLTEIRMIDTYWSDHCRHTTFLTALEDVEIEDPLVQKSWARYQEIKAELGRSAKPDTLMELATEAMRYLKHTGQLTRLDESEEINACTVTVDVEIDGQAQPWLFLFKNETHNHPTEIEPFGGAATCIGGAIRDPLSGRGYVYQAMRVTGAADPTVPLDATLPGKLPQRKIVTTAAAGYSSYGNQIGLATGLVDELYHPGYAAKRLEIGAVVAAVPQAHVRRETPLPGDQVILLGGRTGRDGCGGATGSSKSHTLASLEQCGAEVQKGNAPEERKLQRLFRNPAAAGRIKRCNDFGAGGVSVAIGELCDGLEIDLDKVPKKYEGLDGTELAISESQERMAIVVDPADVEAFLRLADAENLEATVVAEVREEPRLKMRWNGSVIVDLARSFLNSNGAEKHARAAVALRAPAQTGTPHQNTNALAGSLAVCSRRGLAERFDSTIGASTVLMPFGGKHQQTPAQVMAAKFPVLQGETDQCSVMAYGFDPYLTERDPYKGAYCAVVESVAKLAAAGCPLGQCYLTFQEYFERMKSPATWGKPLAALLGAMQAQLDLGLASIGGKDSMSGSFEQLNVPPTLVSFAVALCKAGEIISNEFKQAGSTLSLLQPEVDANGLPIAQSLHKNFAALRTAIARGDVLAAHALTGGGVEEAILKMALGNKIGAEITGGGDFTREYTPLAGDVLVELKPGAKLPGAVEIGRTTAAYIYNGEDLQKIEALYEQKLEGVFPLRPKAEAAPVEAITYTQRSAARSPLRAAAPRVLIPVFPGTNCEYDTARAFERAGAAAEILVINNKTAQGLADSVERAERALQGAQILFLPGGFSGGDEPDGSGKFITAFLRNPRLAEAVTALLETRGGLVGGICNGFQALIKLGLVPYGKIQAMTPQDATLTFNTIGRHQSKLVRTRVASVLSPWLALCEPGEVHLAPVSHGEGRFVCPAPLLAQLVANGQIATQYVDLEGAPTMDVQYNPNGSVLAAEGITSPDGRVFGKMGHSERTGRGLYKNVPGETENKMFRAAVGFFG